MRQAVKQNGDALDYASEDLRGNHDIVLEVPLCLYVVSHRARVSRARPKGDIYEANRCASINGSADQS